MRDIHSMPGHLIRRLQQISASVFSERVGGAGYDLTSVQYAALSAIVAVPGLDQATVAGLIAYDRVTIGGVIDRLEQKKLVERHTSNIDRRAKELYPTRSGKKTFDAMRPIVNRLQPEILTGLTKQERATFCALLKKTTSAGNEASRAPLDIARLKAKRESA
jgi:DNA-binding MarR family transcriptional regulator